MRTYEILILKHPNPQYHFYCVLNIYIYLLTFLFLWFLQLFTRNSETADIAIECHDIELIELKYISLEMSWEFEYPHPIYFIQLTLLIGQKLYHNKLISGLLTFDQSGSLKCQLHELDWVRIFKFLALLKWKGL